MRTSSILTGFVVGGALGAAAGLLMAPASGAVTRRKIKDGVEEVQDRAIQAVVDTGGRMVEAVEEVQNKAQHLAADTSKEARYRASKLKKIGKKMVEEQRASLEHAYEKAVDTLKS
jgi:gas vesicle protein